MAPDTAGPMMSPNPHAQDISEIPNAWLLSSDASETTAFTVPTTPVEIIVSIYTRARVHKNGRLE